MPNHLADAISPYLRSHADNPVNWYAWGPEAFAEARARDVPVLVSIGYSTCHWCHVMARQSFSDPAIAANLNDHFVSIKVDREEHPEVDATYLAAASAFVTGLGWPLNVFVTPDGQAFHAGTYFAPQPHNGQPSFAMVLDAVTEAWTSRRAGVLAGAAQVSDALAAAGRQFTATNPLPDETALAAAVAELHGYEDAGFGGFGGAPKFPVAPVLGFLLARPDGRSLALRTLRRIAASPLRDRVEGGFFRYAVNQDWSDPHYERMLYDNAQLLALYAEAFALTGESWARDTAAGIGGFLLGTLQLADGGFASAQDSESTVAGQRVEGGYYALNAADRAAETPPARDEKVLTGWNGLAIGALARAGLTLNDADLVRAARAAADYLLAEHRNENGLLVRASVDGRRSQAPATAEDYGMFAHGLLQLALATGEVAYAVAGRDLVRSTLLADADAAPAAAAAEPVFRVPNGPDPVLAAQGLTVAGDPSEGAYPSGLTAVAEAARVLFLLTGNSTDRRAAEHAMERLAVPAPQRPMAFGAALRLMHALAAPDTQLIVVVPDTAGADPANLLAAARVHEAAVVACVTDAQARAFAAAGFDLFAARTAPTGRPTGYLCHDFVCRLPVTDPAEWAGWADGPSHRSPGGVVQ
ncbi:MAG: DUF255 domain-containing protein [Cryobacterium sp.]